VPQTEPLSETCNVLTPTPTIAPTETLFCAMPTATPVPCTGALCPDTSQQAAVSVPMTLPICGQTPTATLPPTPTPSPTPSLTQTPTPTLYPIDLNMPMPSIQNPEIYGECIEGYEAYRPGCAVQAYNATIQHFITVKPQGIPHLRWVDSLAMTLTGEASIIYAYPDPDEIQCYNDGVLLAGCGSHRSILEGAVVRQLILACGGMICSETNLVKYMAGPPTDQFGIQAWYGSGRASGIPDIGKLLVSNTTSFYQLIDNIEVAYNQPDISEVCANHYCNWG